MKNQKKKGFTLIELLVVIAIIGLLATLSVVALNNARERARDSRRVSDIRQIQTALELYYNSNNDAYPNFGTSGTATVDLAGTAGLSTALQDFINPIPSAPLPEDGTCTNDLGASDNTTGNTYGYWSDGDTYEIYYCLSDGAGQVANPYTISQ